LLIKGRDLRGVHFAMDYLVAQNQVFTVGDGGAATVKFATSDFYVPKISAEGLRVIILGGGDTGSDCLGTALRQKAKSVQQFEIMPEPPGERSETTPWPYWPLKLRSSHAHEEGAIHQFSRRFGVTTEEFVAVDGSNSVAGLKVRHLSGTTEVIPADLVILALGFTGVGHAADSAFSQAGLVQNGRISSDARMQTSLPKVYAAGDARRGASLIVWAIAEGRKMAASIHRQFQVELSL
jgi:glutamate synthase (NADPH/NADH) small chain